MYSADILPATSADDALADAAALLDAAEVLDLFAAAGDLEAGLLVNVLRLRSAACADAAALALLVGV